jgi:hypothetical protein
LDYYYGLEQGLIGLLLWISSMIVWIISWIGLIVMDIIMILCGWMDFYYLIDYSNGFGFLHEIILL